MKILIVDDNEENRYLQESLLMGNGHDVHVAINGSEALARLQSEDFELVISDILMPVMDGYELCRKIKTNERLRHIPFIFCTATYTGPQDEAFALKIGADSFLRKPCEPYTFMDVVRETMAAAGRGVITPMEEYPQEEEMLKLYNERLVRKLEQKMLQLEEETKALLEAKRELSISEKKYRRLHESMMDGYVYVDMKGFIRESNESFQIMLGYTKEELVHLDNLDLTLVNWHTYIEGIIRNQVLLKGYSDVFEIEYRKKDGSIFPAELRIFLLHNDSGEKEGMWAIVRDITERKRAERSQKELGDQLRQAQKMEAIGTLAGGIAHDFNNILTVIMGFGGLLQMKMEESDPLRNYIDQILSSSEKASNLTRSLLAFSRKQPIALAPVSINTCIKGTEKLLKRLLTEDIELSISLTNEDIIIMADATQIDQILFNLATNARDAMKNGGKLTIETKLFEMDDRFKEFHGFGDPGRYALLSVSDTGCGMDEATKEKIFEPFFTTKELGKGTGLGLSTAYGIVSQHNGYIVLSSEPDKGTIFSVYLPAIEAAAKGAKTFSSAIKGGIETILIAEDDTGVRLFMKEALANHGYTVIEAKDGQDAIDKFKEYGNIDLLILDSVMPRKNGREAYDEIRSIKPLTKALFMSGYTKDIVLDKGVEERAVDFIVKPILSAPLLKQVREILDK